MIGARRPVRRTFPPPAPLRTWRGGPPSSGILHVLPRLAPRAHGHPRLSVVGHTTTSILRRHTNRIPPTLNTHSRRNCPLQCTVSPNALVPGRGATHMYACAACPRHSESTHRRSSLAACQQTLRVSACIYLARKLLQLQLYCTHRHLHTR